MRLRLSLAALLTLLLGGCTSARVASRPLPARTCVVLSVGGARGLAHLGALRAVQASGLQVDCVVGNSMGALAGALYASAPAEDPPTRFLGFLRAYEAESRREAKGRAVGGGVVAGLLAALLTGGAVLPMVAGAAVGGLAGASGTEPVDHVRFVRVLDAYVEGRSIEQLPVPFATQVEVRAGQGVRIVDSRTGNLARAVGGSVANPFIFRALDVRGAQGIDPGVDRAAATPVEDACRLFPDAKLLVLNVSGQPVFTSAAMRCPTLEVSVDMGEVQLEAAFRPGPAFDRVVQAGEDATSAALASPRWTWPGSGSPEPLRK